GTYWHPYECAGLAGCSASMGAAIDADLARIPASKQIVLVTMAFDRAVVAGTEWQTDIPTLTALQDVPYMKAYNNPRVVGLRLFAYARGYPQGATRDYPSLKARHQDQGAQLMRWMSIDVPSSGTVLQPFAMGGWAVDLAASDGPGVSAIHVWAWPSG